MPSQQFIKTFRKQYGAALAVIVLLLIVSQVIIQTALMQETAVRASSALAKGLTTRELYMSINARNIEIDPVNRLAYIKNINKVYVQWQQWEQEVYMPTYSSNTRVQAYLHAAIPYYLVLKEQIGIILRTDSGTKAVNITPELRAMITPDIQYLSDLYLAYSIISTDADTYVVVVQWIEFIVFLASLGVLAYERFVAIRIAQKELNVTLLSEQRAQKPLPANVTPFPTVATQARNP